MPQVAREAKGGWVVGASPVPPCPSPAKSFACGARLFIAHKNLADDAGEQVTEAEVQARLGAEMASARDGLVEVNFVCRVRGRAIQLFDESEHFADLRPDETVTVQTPPRRNWSARCDGVTVVLWPVPAGGAAFELGADVQLPQARARRSTAGTRPSGRFSPEDEAARPQLSTSK